MTNLSIKNKYINNKRNIFLSLGISVLLLIGGYFVNNMSIFTIGEALEAYSKLEIFNYYTKLNTERTDIDNDTNVVYINVGSDKELVADESGNKAITDRTKLYKFLSHLQHVNYDYIIIDIMFTKGYRSNAKIIDDFSHDTVSVDDKLFNLIGNMRNVVVATHDGIKLENSKLEKKAALADYNITLTSTNFVRFEYFDSTPYIPLKVYNELQKQQDKDTVVCYYPFGYTLKLFAIYKQGNQLCYNTLFIDFGLYNKTNENRIKVADIYNLGNDILEVNKTEQELHRSINNICKKHIVIIGDTGDGDKHSTYAGEKTGPEIIYRSFRALENGKHLISPWQILFLFLIYFSISLSILTQKNIFNHFNLKVGNKFIVALAEIFTFSSILILYNIILYLTNRDSFSFTLPILFFTFLKLYKKITQV